MAASTNRDNGSKGSEKLNLGGRRPLPPLNALRAFEAAARCGGFHAAGSELRVSANAVGRLVKILEEWLEVALFRRLARGVMLTDAGRDYLERVGALLDQLADATAELQRREASKVLTVSALPSFVARWLIPRLGRLTERHPDLDVRVLASVPQTDFAREEVDVAIRLGPGTYEGLRSDLLLREDFYPVCSPALLARKPRLRKPKDLAKHVLLHDEPERRIPLQIDWRRWLDAVGAHDVEAHRDLCFSYSHMSLQAAAAGQGVALASSALIGDDWTTGRLVRPFGDLSVRGPYGFFLVCPFATAERDKVVAFRRWALEEAQVPGPPSSSRRTSPE
ncbi:transcriptional regulator GcvA [Pendulispora albinea]|uniref:Transcriptional regulator GcvA n=1 Tax=Pendulispora albinea TaxID=2741071 RepID=A0ABZ2M374_9BACT